MTEQELQDAEAAITEWLAERPECVRAVAERFRPWRVYRLRPTNQRVTIYSFSEPEDANDPVTMTVTVQAALNEFAIVDYNVFGIDPNDLESED